VVLVTAVKIRKFTLQRVGLPIVDPVNWTSRLTDDSIMGYPSHPNFILIARMLRENADTYLHETPTSCRPPQDRDVPQPRPQPVDILC
jgi:hypothetical protein